MNGSGRTRATVISFLVVAGPVSAQGVLTGRVVGGSPVAPLVGVEVEVRGASPWKATTDSAGDYRIDGIAPGQYTVLFRRIGFQPAERGVFITSGETTYLLVELAAAAVALDSITVEAEATELLNPRMAGFTERRKQGLGRFLDSRELTERKGRDIESLLRELKVPFKRRHRGRYAAEDRGPSSLQGDHECLTKVMIDGIYVTRPYRHETDIIYIHQYPNARTIAAIEYYRGAGQIPLQFQTDETQCGVIVIWTRMK